MEKNFGTWNRNQNLGKMVWFPNTAFAFGYILIYIRNLVLTFRNLVLTFRNLVLTSRNLVLTFFLCFFFTCSRQASAPA